MGVSPNRGTIIEDYNISGSFFRVPLLWETAIWKYIRVAEAFYWRVEGLVGIRTWNVELKP